MRISYLRWTDRRTDRQNISAGVELRFAAKNPLGQIFNGVGVERKWLKNSHNGIENRLSEHEAAIVNKYTGNAMAKHLAIFHREKEGDPHNLEYSVAATFKKKQKQSQEL